MAHRTVFALTLVGVLLSTTAASEGSDALRALTGERCIVVWMQDLTDNTNYDADGVDASTYRLMGMDTDDGLGERVILSEESNYHCPMPTSDGTRVVYTNYPAQEIYAVNFDGTGKTFLANGAAADLWDDPQTGITWVYYKHPSSNVTSGPVYRMQLDNPGLVETVWSGTMVWIHNFDVSPDGTRAAFSPAGHNLVFLDLLTGVQRQFAPGCNINMSPDDANYTLVMLEDHFSMDMYNPEGTKVAGLPFLVTGAQHARWSNDPDYMVFSGPYPGGWRDNGPHVELQVSSFKHPYTEGFDRNVQITDNGKGDYLARLQVGIKPAGPQLPMLQLSANEKSFQVVPGTSVYEGTITVASATQSNLTNVTISEEVDWLTVTPSAASGATITLTNTADCTGLEPQVHTGYVTVSANGHHDRTYHVTLVVGGPYNGDPVAVPGTIQAEEYDIGANGVAYMDKDMVNEGAQFRTDGVDIEVCHDAGGGYNVGWVAEDEWLNYTVRVDLSASYIPSLRFATAGTGARVHLEVNGVAGETVELPSTGSWGGWETFTMPALALQVGQANLRIVSENGGLNINYLTLALPEADSSNAVQLGSPRGGEQFAVGDTIAVSWFADTLYAPGIVVQFSADAGEVWHMLTTETIDNTTGQGVFTWVIPESLRGESTVSNTCLIRVEEYSAPFADVSGEYFTILGDDGTDAAAHARLARAPIDIRPGNHCTLVDIVHAGAHRIRLYSLSGVVLWEAVGREGCEYRVPSMYQVGVLQIDVGDRRWTARSMGR